MRLGWKFLLPVNLVWLLVVAGLKVMQSEGITGTTRWLILVGGVLVIMLGVLLWPSKKPGRTRTLAEQVAARPSGSFPVPPIDLQVPPSPRAKRGVAERVPANEAQRQPASVGAGPESDSDSDEKEV
jgi:NADH-quinone oxidoreductase subunit H